MPKVALLVTVETADLDAEEHEEHAAELGRLLKDLPATEPVPIPGPPSPDGAKGTARC